MPINKNDNKDDQVTVTGPFGTGIKGPVWLVLAIALGVVSTSLIQKVWPDGFTAPAGEQAKIAARIDTLEQQLATMQRGLTHLRTDLSDLLSGANGTMPAMTAQRFRQLEQRISDMAQDVDRLENDLRDLRRRQN